ncbi:TnsD family Tn7-like transposition protein [Acinetobacter variabilis]|uniref:TnsD family Tn7-like transposition protein n=1 Tax=Acinetobacter TaxID=469 RepID=UPI0015D3E610|nr:TnsD family Tn7-like transposition protein [Acinetobacter sp. YH12035]
MLNFPMPYEHELIYSTVARAGIRLAFESPKQLLDAVFENRQVIATVDLPCHLNAIVNQYSEQQLTLQNIIYKHTLFPIYAPFVPEARRKQCIKWMGNISQGSVHLSLGINASRVPIIDRLRYCPQCLKEQAFQKGEFYWLSLWQIQGACCPQHGNLVESRLDLRSLHRHDFIAPSDVFCTEWNQVPATSDELFISSKIIELLSTPPFVSPSYEQWTMFYNELARRNNCIRGENQIAFDQISEKISLRWPEKFLQQYHLDDLASETSWLRHIFRKHRKSFSYLEHIITIEAFLNTDWSFTDIFTQVKSFKKATTQQNNQIKFQDTNFEITRAENREKWVGLVQEHGVKPARHLQAALYAWLYRNDKDWLLQTNQNFHQKFIPQGTKIDWQKRDLFYVKQLVQLNNTLIWDLDSPRRSMKWWFKQTSNSNTLEKNLHKLPLIQLFLERYSENISCYQIRRLTKVFIDIKINKQSIPQWRILRKAGLSGERMTSETKRFLEYITLEFSQIIQN